MHYNWNTLPSLWESETRNWEDIIGLTYENVLYDFVMDPIRDLFIAEYHYKIV